jgi:putative ubiquitin-RnfH superfamily antitoxin RatB of RatAB toxin-antitoxin module
VVGVFGQAAGREKILEAGDRVELYRELAADPKAARRARVKQARRRSSQGPQTAPKAGPVDRQ